MKPIEKPQDEENVNELNENKKIDHTTIDDQIDQLADIIIENILKELK